MPASKRAIVPAPVPKQAKGRGRPKVAGRDPEKLAKQLAQIEQADQQLAYPVFLGSRQQFVERLGQFLPDLAERTVEFLTARPERVVTPQGAVLRMLPEDKDLTEGQIAMAKLILGKIIPAATQLDSQGNDTNRSKGPKKINVTINQVGGTLNDEQMHRATVNGVTGAEAQEVTKIKIKRAAVIDVTPETEQEKTS